MIVTKNSHDILNISTKNIFKCFKQFLHIRENCNIRFQIKDNFIFLQKFIEELSVQKQ